MTKEDKELLLKDLSSRLSYGVKFLRESWNYEWDQEMSVIEVLEDIDKDGYINNTKVYSVVDIKPYLRPMDSMTEEETNEYNKCFEEDRDDIMPIGKEFEESYKSKKFSTYSHPFVPMYRHIIWLFKNHFDFMGLIPKGLAIAVTEENNPYKIDNL